MKNHKTKLKIFIFIIAITLFGYTACYAEVEPLELPADEMYSINSIEAAQAFDTAVYDDPFVFQAPDAYGPLVDGTNQYGNDSYSPCYDSDFSDLGFTGDIWSNEDEGQPSILSPQDNVSHRYTDNRSLEEQRKGYKTEPLIEDWLPETDQKRPARPYVNIGPLYKEYSKYKEKEEEEYAPTTSFIHGGGVESARWLTEKASVDQGRWQDPEKTWTKKLFRSYLGGHRLPSIGHGDFSENSFEAQRSNDKDSLSIPQITLDVPYGYSREGQYKIDESDQVFSSSDSPVNPVGVLAHEYEHSFQISPHERIERDDSGQRLIIDDQEREKLEDMVPARRGGLIQVIKQIDTFPKEGPAVWQELLLKAARHKEQTGRDLDLTLVFPPNEDFPEGREVYLPSALEMAKEHHVFSPDPETGTNNTISQLMTTPVGARWYGSLLGDSKDDKGTAYMGHGDNRVDAPWWPEPDPKTQEITGMKEPWFPKEQADFTPEAMEIFEENTNVMEFLEELGLGDQMTTQNYTELDNSWIEDMQKEWQDKFAGMDKVEINQVYTDEDNNLRISYLADRPDGMQLIGGFRLPEAYSQQDPSWARQTEEKWNDHFGNLEKGDKLIIHDLHPESDGTLRLGYNLVKPPRGLIKGKTIVGDFIFPKADEYGRDRASFFEAE